METIFSKIRDNLIPSVKIYEDDICFVILDINPIVKGHSLVISKTEYPTITETPDEILQHLICIAKKTDEKLRKVLNCEGTNILINNGKVSGQEVAHLHIHVIPRFCNDGRKFNFEHDQYSDNEAAEIGKKLKF